MRFVTFSSEATVQTRLGLLVGERSVVDLANATRGVIDVPPSLGDYISAGPELNQKVQRYVQAVSEWPVDVSHPIGDVRVHAPFRPGKIIGVGLNYVEHVERSKRSGKPFDLPDRPVLFSKPGTAIIGPGDPIQHDGRITKQLDWECELAVVIGKTVRGVGREEAMASVFGYSIMNDISARDQLRYGQWFFSKGQDSYAPFGPAVVSVDEIDDPHDLGLSLDVNGVERQNGHSGDMLFRIPDLIVDISAGMTLEPGDVISTGSPSGVGSAMDPPTFLQPGDIVSAHIDRIGVLTNPVLSV